MSKLLGAIAGLGLIGGGAYYVSNAVAPDIDTPPYLAAGSATSVQATLAMAALPVELAPLDGQTNSELASIADVRIVPEHDSGALRWTFAVDDARYVTVVATLKAVGAKTAVDVTVVFPDSPFTQAGILHPYDLKVLAAAIDLGATEYIASIIEKRPPRSWSSLGRTFVAKLGFDDAQKDAMALRIQAALSRATIPIRERAMARTGGSSEEIARAMDDAADAMGEAASDADRDRSDRGRNYDPRDTMREGASPTMSAQPMVDVGNGR